MIEHISLDGVIQSSGEDGFPYDDINALGDVQYKHSGDPPLLSSGYLDSRSSHED